MKPGKRKKTTFVMVRHDIYDSDAFQTLTPTQRCVWFELIRRHNGYNNGRIVFGCREMGKRVKVSKDTAKDAFDKLQEVGLITNTRHSAFHVKIRISREWKLNHERCDNKPATHEWKKFKIRSD